MAALEFEERLKVNAYRLFHAELHKHLETVRTGLSPSAKPSNEDLKKLGSIFHLLRGGAGFFGLDELAQLSKRLEELLLHESAQAVLRVDEARKLIQEVERLAGNIPAPVSQD